MSKRFGRNQKRRLTRALESLEMHKAELGDRIGSNMAELSRLRSRLRDAEAVLGVDHPAFPPNHMYAQRPTRRDPDYAVRMRNGIYVNPMAMHTREVLDHREQAHVMLTYGGHIWGYAITYHALRCCPREVLARHMAHAFTEMALQELNKMGVRR